MGNYYDHVGLSITPMGIQRDVLGSSLGDAGTGTYADPFHRIDQDAQSISDGPFSDIFEFGGIETSVNSITMRYNNGPTSNEINGTQAIFIPSITFNMPCEC